MILSVLGCYPYLQHYFPQCTADTRDNCEQRYNRRQRDSNRNGVGDACEKCHLIRNPGRDDADNDGVRKECDNCLGIQNSDQADYDSDGVGDVCDNCPYHHNPAQGDPTEFGDKCTRKPANVMYYDDNDDLFTSDKKGLEMEIMEKLLEMYYAN